MDNELELASYLQNTKKVHLKSAPHVHQVGNFQPYA